VPRLALWQRKPGATQFVLKDRNTESGVAPAAVVYGVECRGVWREAAIAAGVSRISQRQTAQLGAVGRVIDLCIRCCGRRLGRLATGTAAGVKARQSDQACKDLAKAARTRRYGAENKHHH
jgi:hypothetical protein